MKKRNTPTFARLMVATMKMDKLDDAIKIYKESILPAAKSQKGFRGGYLLIDRKTGKEVSISLWDSEEDAIANEQSGYLQEQVNKMKECSTAPPTLEARIPVTLTQRVVSFMGAGQPFSE